MTDDEKIRQQALEQAKELENVELGRRNCSPRLLSAYVMLDVKRRAKRKRK